MADNESGSSEDEDYVPEGLVEDESADSDAGGVEGREGDLSKDKKMKTKKRQRKQLEEKAEEGGKDDRQLLEEERKVKERVDNLWASFKEDVSSQSSSAAKGKRCPSIGEERPTKTMKEETAKETVTITKSYDFAGEEVRVTQEVKKDSKEGKLFLSSLEKSSSKSEDEQKAGKSVHSPLNPNSTGKGKRLSGLSSVLSQISKKPKMSTLEKSKLDWDIFKQKEGIEDELIQGTKDGYLEKKAFLERTQWKEYELERDERLKRS